MIYLYMQSNSYIISCVCNLAHFTTICIYWINISFSIIYLCVIVIFCLEIEFKDSQLFFIIYYWYSMYFTVLQNKVWLNTCKLFFLFVPTILRIKMKAVPFINAINWKNSVIPYMYQINLNIYYIINLKPFLKSIQK